MSEGRIMREILARVFAGSIELCRRIFIPLSHVNQQQTYDWMSNQALPAGENRQCVEQIQKR